MFKRVLSIVLVLIMTFSFASCKKEADETENSSTSSKTSSSGETTSTGDDAAMIYVLPEYDANQFEISGFWAPYDISEEGLQEYKDVGFTTLAMINHSLGRTSEEQFYLGSERTMKALESCKKVGLNAILNYNDWMAESCEEDGKDYYGETPFSKHDVYGDYKDIITGIHICDEPYKDRHIDLYSNMTLINDFKKVYPNADYIVNLIPFTAYASRGFESYDEMMQIYEEKFMEPFGNKSFVSVDVYPFHQDYTMDDGTLLVNYRYIADSAKKYGIKPGYILQSSVGGADEGRKEFEMELSESDLRWEVYNALAFGADTLQYYCYSVPKSFDENGDPVYMYDYCILDRNDNPSPVYYSLQKIHKEIQSYANVLLAYDWDKTIGISGSVDQTFRISALEYESDLVTKTSFDGAKNYVSSQGTQDMIVSHFTSSAYGDAYMFLNWAERGNNNIVEVQFKDCTAIAIYGGTGFSGEAMIVELDANGKAVIELEYGEGVLVTPLNKTAVTK